MKNLYKYLFIAIGLFAFSAQAQPGGTRSLAIEVLTPVLNSPRLDTALEARVILRNQSDVTVDVRVSKEYLSTLPGTSYSQICWANLCYPPNVNTPNGTESIPSLGSNTNFKGDFWPDGSIGSTRVKYCFINAADASDSVCTIITFNAGPVSSRAKNELKNMVAFPNPATNFVNLAFAGLTSESRFEVMNVIGKKVLSQQLAAGTSQVAVEVKGFAKGQYFATLTDINNKRVGAVRFIVK